MSVFPVVVLVLLLFVCLQLVSVEVNADPNVGISHRSIEENAADRLVAMKLSSMRMHPDAQCGDSVRDCARGFTFAAKPGFIPKANGCGLAGATVPTEHTPCCNRHDLCYNDCRRFRLDCDAEFYSCMTTLCENQYQGAERKLCKADRDILSAALAFGCPTYRASLREACECRPN